MPGSRPIPGLVVQWAGLGLYILEGPDQWAACLDQTFITAKLKYFENVIGPNFQALD